MTISHQNHLPLPQVIAVMFEQTLTSLMNFLEENGYDDIRTSHVLNVILHLRGEGMRSSEIAKRAGMTPQAMGELIDFLESRGYVMRIPDPADGRAKLVMYGERGLDAAQKLNHFYADLESEWITAIGDDSGAVLRHSLQLLAERANSNSCQ